MAKVKNKRNSGLADKVHKKRKADINKKKLNPFEVHINKEKIKVLGKKSKHDRGLPGVSRAKAIQKRKETLGTEMKLMNKTNAFIDRRIGEKNNELSAEDRMIARFAAERAKQHGKKSIYNLADDEILTHRGQTLEQIEKFDDPRSSDDEEDEGKKFGGLGDDFVSEGHFGGGILSKTEKDGAKSHKDLIEQLIAESKKRKAEKQKEKEQTLDLTEKLDSEWRDLQPVVFKRPRTEEPKESIIDKVLSRAENKSADYDKMMRELKFDRRGTPSDGLKSDEKAVREERERLEKLEKERELRMLGEDPQPVVQKTAPKHRSADDLDDNFALEDEKTFMLAYDKDGKPLVPEHILKDYSVPNAKPKFDDGISDTSSEEEGSDVDSEDNYQDEQEHDQSDQNGQSDSEQSENESELSENEKSDSKHLVKKKKRKSDHQSDQSEQSNDIEHSGSEEGDIKSLVKNKKRINDKGDDLSDQSEQSNDIEHSGNEEGDIKSFVKNKKRINDKGDDLSDQSEQSNDIEHSGSEKSDSNSLVKNKKRKSKQVNNKNDDHGEQNDKNEHSENEESNEHLSKHKKQKTEHVNGEVGNEIKKKGKKGESVHRSEENEDFVQKSDDDCDDEDKESQDSEEEEESNEEQEDKENKEVDDFRDLKSDESGSEDEMVEDVEKIESFFDIKAGEGDNLQELLSNKTPSQQATALQKLIKSYDPGLNENNKENLSRLFAHMLQYINDLFTNLQNEGDVIKAFLIFDKLAPYFYDLTHTNKVSTKKFLVELLKEKHDRFKKNPKKVPDLDTLIFFKLVSLLYPTSDFRHPVTTPSLIFMSEVLTLSRFNNAYSVSRGLFIVTLILEYTVLSKRLVPAAINFLRGILYLCANTSILNPIEVIPPFRLHKDAKILNLEDNCFKMEVDNKMAAKDLVIKEVDNDFKIRCLLTCTMILKEFFNYFNDLEAQECMFEPHLQLFNRIDLDLYPKKVGSMVSETVQYMKAGLEVKTYTPLTREKKKIKMLRLYEPDVQEVFTGSKSGKLTREQAERARLQTKVKKEMKGALREIRRDKAYIASVKIRQKIQSDNMRKAKVKQIYKDAAIQQGELNKLKRIK